MLGVVLFAFAHVMQSESLLCFATSGLIYMRGRNSQFRPIVRANLVTQNFKRLLFLCEQLLSLQRVH